MIQVDIKRNSDNSIGWSGQFSDQTSADAWVAQEQTNGSWGDPSTYTIVETDLGNSVQMATVRSQRAQLLAACDWTQLTDSPLTSDKKTAWATYRQALRDLPDQPGFDPNNFTWPTAPSPGDS